MVDERRRCWKRTSAYLGPGIVLILAGVAWPIPSYLKDREAWSAYEDDLASRDQALADFHGGLKHGDVSKRAVSRKLEQLEQQRESVKRRHADQVNGAARLHEARRLQGVAAAVLGFCVVLFALRFTAPKRLSPLDRVAPFEAEVEV